MWYRGRVPAQLTTLSSSSMRSHGSSSDSCVLRLSAVERDIDSLSDVSLSRVCSVAADVATVDAMSASCTATVTSFDEAVRTVRNGRAWLTPCYQLFQSGAVATTRGRIEGNWGHNAPWHNTARTSHLGLGEKTSCNKWFPKLNPHNFGTP